MTRDHKKSSNTTDHSACNKSVDFSRRDFMKRSGFALAGTLLASRASIAVNSAPRKVRIGVVGGGFGCSFQWHEHPDCIVQAVSDLREDRR